MKSDTWPRRNIATFLAAALLFSAGILTSAPIASAAGNFTVYGEYVPGSAVYGVDGYGDLLYYDDGRGVAHIMRVSAPNPNVVGGRTYTPIGTYNFKAVTGWSAGQYGEFYVDKGHIYYGPGANGKGGIERWAKNPDGTFGAYLGRLNIPVLNKGITLAYDAANNVWYSGTASRAIYSYKAGVDSAWRYEFTYPTYGNGQGRHGGMEFVGGSLWVSETNTDVIAQWQKTGSWREIERFSYSYSKDVQGLGFGPLGHFWAAAGGGTMGEYPPLYELGGLPTDVAAGFAWTPEPQDEGSPTSFTDTSTSWPDVIVSRSWDFDNGATSALQNPTVTYGDDGVFTVRLSVANSNGYQVTVSNSVTVLDVAPTVDAGTGQATTEGDAISFSGSFIDPGWLDTHNVEWDFGDGSRSSGTLTPAHAYGDDGNYTVTLTVTDDDGGVGTDTLTVTVTNAAPAANVPTERTADEGSPIAFSASASDDGSDDLTFAWDWGDGTPPTVTVYFNDGASPDASPSPLGAYPFLASNTVQHTYGDDGTYAATLTVSDDDGGVTSQTVTVVVNNAVPPAELGGPYWGDEGSPIAFSASASDDGSDDLTFAWDWGDGTPPTVTVYFNDGASPDASPSPLGTYPSLASNTVQHTYGDDGSYTATLTVADDDGGVTSQTVTVVVNNVAPAVNAGPDQAAREGDTVAVRGSFGDPGWLDTHSATIDWGDGTVEPATLERDGENHTVGGTHVYPHEGAYSIAVTVSDDEGATGRDTLMLFIPLGLTVSATPGRVPTPSDAQSIPLRDIPLRDIPLRDIPLRDIPLRDISIADTPLRDIPLRDISIDWGPILAGTTLEGADPATITLEQALQAGIPLPDVTLAAIPLRDIPLRDIPLRDIPWESIPLRDISPQLALTSQNAVTYTVAVANYGNTDAENVVISYTLPEGFVYLPGSSTGATVADPLVEAQTLSWGPFAVPANNVLSLSFGAAAPLSLGTYLSDVAVTSNLDFPPATDAAPVMVTDTFEPNDSWQQAQEIGPDSLYLSYISSETDTDWFKMPVPLAKGTVVTAYLSHLPADFDLVLLAASAESLAETPLRDIPLRDIPLRDIPLRDIPLRDIPLRDIPLRDITLQDIPLRDIPLRDIPLRDISMERGTTDETIVSRVVNETGYYYILVFGYNGAHSDEPYVLRAKATPPPAVDVPPRGLPSSHPDGTAFEESTVFEPYGVDTETIIVTSQQRLEQYYGHDAVLGSGGLRAELEAFAELGNVKGLIVPVDYYQNVKDAYVAWDAKPGDTEAANSVAAAIKTVLNGVLSSHSKVRYVVIVGSDEVLPFHRVPDEVYLSNESAYAARAHLGPSALYASLLQGNILTDDYYADMTPVPWRGRELYVPDYAIGRLVEKPDEMIALLRQFAANRGILEAKTALVTGYDFLTDGAGAIVDALRAGGLETEQIELLINEFWTDASLEIHLLAGLSHDLSSLNAHFNHWALGPPDGSLFYSSQILSSYLEGKLVFSTGCHSGLNVDDSVSHPDDVSKPGDWSLDFPQAFARKAAWFVGNTGYGYGDTDIVALSEQLMSNFADALAAEGAVGKALVKAKQDYFLTMGGYGPFDEKIMIEATLYGLPMYRVVVATSPLPVEDAGTPLVIDANRLVNFEPVDSFRDEANLVVRTTADGRFYSADGETQFTPYRPVQPRTSLGIDYPGQVAHGALLTAGTYEEHHDFDPVIARPIDDQTMSLYEPQIINEAWYPSKLQTIVSLQGISGAVQRMVIIPGQFIATTSTAPVTGTERVYTSLSYDIYYSTSQDYSPPVIELADVTVGGSAGDFTAHFSIQASDSDAPAIPDDGRVTRVVATWSYVTGDTTWKSVDLQYDAATRTWTGDLPGLAAADIDVTVQAVDAAGNVGSSTSKGFFFTPIPVEAGDDQTVREGDAVTLQGNVGAMVDSASVLWDFGDGATTKGALNASHVFGDNGVYTVSLRVADGKGGAGWDTLTVTVLNATPEIEVPAAATVRYSDPLDLTGSFTDAGSRDTHTYRWDVSDPAGTPVLTVWGNPDLTVDWLRWLGAYPTPGEYTATLTVTDDDGAAGQGTTRVTITRADTSTAVSSSMNPSVFGQSVTFTATVSADLPDRAGVPSPTGSITFADGATTLSTVPLNIIDGLATASFSTASLLAGTHGITTTYDGDFIFSSSSGSLAQSVAKASTATTVVSSVNPSVLGQAVTFTAVVSVSTAEGSLVASPTGTVTFADGATDLGTVPVSNIDGKMTASFSTSVLSVGSHNITATYNGDDNFKDSSAARTQAVFYNFAGFLDPVPNSQYNRSRTIPIKFTLTDFNGVTVGTAVAIVSVNGGPAVGIAEYNTTSQQYHFNLQTDGLPLGTLIITVSPDDGTAHTVTVQLK